MTALLGGAVLRQVLDPTDPITVFRKTIEVAAHPVAEAVSGVGEVMEAMMEVRGMVLMIQLQLLLTTVTTTGLKIRSIKTLVTVDLHRLLNTEPHLVHQAATIRDLIILKVRLKLRLK
jgi:hypothetical protein